MHKPEIETCPHFLDFIEAEDFGDEEEDEEDEWDEEENEDEDGLEEEGDEEGEEPWYAVVPMPCQPCVRGAGDEHTTKRSKHKSKHNDDESEDESEDGSRRKIGNQKDEENEEDEEDEEEEDEEIMNYNPDCRHHHHHAVHFGTPVFVVFELSPEHRVGKQREAASNASFKEPASEGVADYITIGCTSVALGNHMKIYGCTDGKGRIVDGESGLCLMTLKGHIKSVLSVCEADGDIYLASEDHTITRWCVETGMLERTFIGHGAGVNSICVHNGIAFSGSDDKTAIRWNIDTGKQIVTYKGHTGAVLAACAGMGKTLCTGSEDCTVREWDVKKARCLRIMQHTEPIVELSCLKAGTILVGISPSGLCKMWSGKTRELVFTGRGINQWQNYKDLLPTAFQNKDPFGDGVCLGASFSEVMHLLHIGPEDVGGCSDTSSEDD